MKVHSIQQAQGFSSLKLNSGSIATRRTVAAEVVSRSALRVVPRDEAERRRMFPKRMAWLARPMLIDSAFMALTLGAAAVLCWSEW